MEKYFQCQTNTFDRNGENIKAENRKLTNIYVQHRTPRKHR